MGNLTFYHSAMNAGKSSHLLQNAFQYESHGFTVLCGTPSLDNRFGEGKITSRIGLSRDALTLPNYLYKFQNAGSLNPHRTVIFVDEAQFLSVNIVEEFRNISLWGPNVKIYGLKNNFKGEIFSDSISFLLANADEIIELECLCWCGKQAKHNFRYDSNFTKVSSGNTIELGAEDKYISVCNEHFYFPSATENYLQHKD